MQFKYPEILYALLLLLIPIIVHLFQLRRFEKVAFTNVDFLKKIELQTRKSAKLKKFLILLSRLGLFAALIVAFAQPYFSKNKKTTKPQTVLYLDNSLSMQAKNGSNELFKKAVQDIISNYSATENISIITNTDTYKNLSDKDLKNQLLSLKYHAITQDLKTTLLKARKLNTSKSNLRSHLILISDFQSNSTPNELKLDSTTQYSFVQLLPQKKENIAIDSVYIAKQNGLDITLNIVLKSFNTFNENLAVSLFKEKILIGKTATKIEENKTNTVSFKIPFNDSFNGKIVIDDNLIPFDNELFFSLNKVEKINVMAIGNNNAFLSKIFTASEFNLSNKKISQLDYNKIANQNLIVLNELETIPLSLQKIVSKFVASGGSLAVIPAIKTNIENYNQFFNSLKVGSITEKSTIEHQINSINFSHPILDNVFEKQVKNFQYPNVKNSFSTHLKNGNAILKFDNQQPFISQTKVNKGSFYWIAAPINQANSNFKNSPLIVPIFYNFGKQSFKITQLYYTIGNTNKIDIQTKINKDNVLQITSNASSFIPLQQVSQNKVSLTTNENPLTAGHFKIKKGTEFIKNIAFNYNRNESNTTYNNIKEQLKNYKNADYSTNIKQTFEQISNQYKMSSFWKWLIGLAILFWIIEMLLVKFMK